MGCAARLNGTELAQAECSCRLRYPVAYRCLARWHAFGWGWRGGSSLCLLPLKARSAQHRSALGRLERNRGFGTALRTCRARLRTDPSTAGTLCLALLAVFGVILELFVVEKELLTGGEDKLSPAVITLQNSVGKFHGLLPRCRERRRNRPWSSACRSRFPVFVRLAVTRARTAINRRLVELSFPQTGRPR